MLLALAEFGVSRALLAILGVVVINQLGENMDSTRFSWAGLSLSPTIVFLSFTLGVASRRTGGFSGHAHHPLHGGDVRYLPGDPLACEPHDTARPGHRPSCPRRWRSSARDECQSSAGRGYG